MLHIVVCGKVVPERTVPLDLDPTTGRLVRQGISHELDPAAEHALEAGIRLIEQHGGTLSFLTMGMAEIGVGIRKALQFGATSAVHLLDDAFAGSDTLGTAKALAAAIRRQTFDLILCGSESSDSAAGIVPAQLAQLLGIPALTFAQALELEGSSIVIRRQTAAGYTVAAAPLPALVSVVSSINEARAPNLKAIMAARRIEIETLSAADLGLAADQVGAAAARERVTDISRPPLPEPGLIVRDDGTGAQRILEFLAARGVR